MTKWSYIRNCEECGGMLSVWFECSNGVGPNDMEKQISLNIIDVGFYLQVFFLILDSM